MHAARRAKLYRGTLRNLKLLARALARGKLVAVPTETVYGLAGDALNPRACRAIFRAKGRPSNDPLIVHIHSLAQLGLIAEPNPLVDLLAAAFWPGPLTLVLPKKKIVPDVVTAGGPSVAIRWPAHPLFLKLLRLCEHPLAAPSANQFGYVSPTTAAHVTDGLGGRIDFILDGGPSKIGLESTILDLRNPSRPRLLRPGAIERSDLERTLGCKVGVARKNSTSATARVLAPGMLSKHYSPRTPLTLHSRLSPTESLAAPKEAFLFFKKPEFKSDPRPRRAEANTRWLSEQGSFEEAARSLFSVLRELDGGGWSRLHAERAPGKSALALAINDRLTRAAAKS